MFTALAVLPAALAASGINPTPGDWGLPLLALLFPLVMFVLSLLVFY